MLIKAFISREIWQWTCT